MGVRYVTRVVGLVALLLLVSGVLFAKSEHPRGSSSHDHHADVQPVPFSYCKPFLERLSHNDQHQLRESYQHYHNAFAMFTRAARNLEAFQRGIPDWAKEEEQKQAWNLTYIAGQNEVQLQEVYNATRTMMNNMEQRIGAQLKRLEEQGSLPANTAIDALSPCIMRKIYPSQFPDQPDVSLLLRLRGFPANPADWPQRGGSSSEPPTGKGPEVVDAFLKRAMRCGSVAHVELIVVLSGEAASSQATTWAWQSWQTDGFVVPLVDMLDREAHVLNRAASVARGSILVALRTDQPGVEDLLTGRDCSWLQRVVTLYHRIPQLGALTHGAYSFSHPPTTDGHLRMLGSPLGVLMGGGGPHRNNEFFKERVTSVPFQYVMYGDYMPMSFRRSALEEVGGFDEDLPQGDGQCSAIIRHDLSLRLWKAGWRVGAHDVGLLELPATNTAPATNSDPSRCSPDVAALATQLFNARHVPSASSDGLPPPSPSPIDTIQLRVRELNLKELDPLEPDALKPCPMEQGCEA